MTLIVFDYAQTAAKVAIDPKEVTMVEEVKKIGELNAETGKWERVEHAQIFLKNGHGVNVTQKFKEVTELIAKATAASDS